MKRSAIALVSVLVLALTGCGGGTQVGGPTGSPAPGNGGQNAPLNRDRNTLVVAVDAFNPDFDPASAYLLSEALIWRGIYESLIRLKGDSASEVEPLLRRSAAVVGPLGSRILYGRSH